MINNQILDHYYLIIYQKYFFGFHQYCIEYKKRSIKGSRSSTFFKKISIFACLKLILINCLSDMSKN